MAGKKRNGRKRKRLPIKRLISRRPTIARSLFPKTHTAVMRYSGVLGLDPAAGSAITHAYSANGLYDPDLTAAGHQPYGYDQITTHYANYRVLWSKITVSAPAIVTDYDCGITVQTDSSTITDLTLIKEQPTTRWVMVGDTAKHVSCSMYPYKFLGLSKKSADYESGTGANPNMQPVYKVFASPQDGSTNLDVLYLSVNIVYIAQFFTPLPYTGS